MNKAGFARSRMRKPPNSPCRPAPTPARTLGGGRRVRCARSRARHAGRRRRPSPRLPRGARRARVRGRHRVRLRSSRSSTTRSRGDPRPDSRCSSRSASLVSLTVGFPGTNPSGLGAVPLLLLITSAGVLIVTGVRRDRQRGGRAQTRVRRIPTRATRPARPRTPRPAHRAARARRGTAPARRAHRDPARPAA